MSPGLGGVIGGTGRLAAGLVLAPYSRDQEREADRLGMELAARGGWDPLGLGDCLETLAAEDALEGHAPDRVGFFSTHPSTPDRMERMRSAAGSFTRTSAPPIAESRGALLGALEGLVVGDNPAYGALEGSTLRHPGHDIALELPSGWKIRRTPEAVGAIAPRGDAIAFLQGVAGAVDPVSGARADGLSDPLIARLERVDISGLPAARLAAETRESERLELTWIAHRRCVVRFAAITEVAGWDRYRNAIESALKSVRPLSVAERDGLARAVGGVEVQGRRPAASSPTRASRRDRRSGRRAERRRLERSLDGDCKRSGCERRAPGGLAGEDRGPGAPVRASAVPASS